MSTPPVMNDAISKPLFTKELDPLRAILGKIVGGLAVWSIFFEIFGGITRFYLAQVGGLFINNIPAVLTVALFGAYYFQAFIKRSISIFVIFLTLMIMFYAVYSTVMPLKNINTVMGFYIWCNFLLGVLVCLYEKEDTIFKFMLVIWGICVFGVILNYFVDYPWVGQSYEVAGTTMEVARDWTDEGFKRLPGFSRMNFVVACHILISCGYILISKRYSKLLKVFVYSLSFLAIGLSTSKTQLMQIATLPALLGTYWALKYRWPDRPLAFYYARGVVVLLVCLVVFLPLTLSTHKHMRMNGPLYGFISGDTFVERMTQMWPEAFDLLDETGNPVFGRGIGGIGTALGMGDPNPYTVNAGDNLFVYVYVEAGYFAAIPFFLGFFLGLGRLYRRNVEYFELIWVTSLCILGTAITAACAEEPTVGMLIGLLVARGYIYPNRLKQLPAPQTS